MTHFDKIGNYDNEIPLHIARYLYKKKSKKIIEILNENNFSRKTYGLDVGCGTGHHLHYIKSALPGIRLLGIDFSSKQLETAINNYNMSNLIQASAESVPVRNNSIDFIYTINCLHHLNSEDSQQDAIQDFYRVLRTKGLLIIYEMNILNPLIKLYLNYIFPRIRKIDEGTEKWLEIDFIKNIAGFKLKSITYQSFVPDFCPKFSLNFMKIVESFLEKTRLSKFGAHVLYVLEKK